MKPRKTAEIVEQLSVEIYSLAILQDCKLSQNICISSARVLKLISSAQSQLAIHEAEPYVTKGQKVQHQRHGRLILCSRKSLGLFEDKYALTNTLTRANGEKPVLLLFS